MTNTLVRLLLASALAVQAGGGLWATEIPEQSVVENWRARVEAARLASVPKPPAGVREMRWNELSPAGWDPGRFLKQLDIGKVNDNDPAAAIAMQRIRQEWDAAPAVSFADDAPVRMTGFPIMLEPGDGLSKTILLVPYRGACIHRPSPPANQMVLVTLRNGLPRNLDGYPIWITGRIYAARNATQHGKVAYTMTNATWSKYPYEKYPIPQYVPLH